MISIWKHLILKRKESTPRIDQVDTGKTVFHCNLLSSQVFLDRERVIGAAFDGGIIGHYHHFSSSNSANPADDPCCWNFIFIKPISSHRRNF